MVAILGIFRSEAAILPFCYSSEPTFSLNCFVLGDDPENVFPVDIQTTSKIGILKDLIKQKKSPRLNHVVASDLEVFQVR